jgi:anti-sigma factor RsiW
VISCAGVLPLLTDLLEAVLPGDVRAGVEAHLAGCAGCRHQLRQLERTIALVRRLDDDREHEPVPARTMAELLAAFREHHRVTAAGFGGRHTRSTSRGGTP